LNNSEKDNLIKKLNALQIRVAELNEQSDGQVEVLGLLTKSITRMVKDLEHEEDSGDREV
tara:strand:- start:1008 stop:1187 length:180 start_codon:yes stop_codon:yes gene_type:complete